MMSIRTRRRPLHAIGTASVACILSIICGLWFSYSGQLQNSIQTNLPKANRWDLLLFLRGLFVKLVVIFLWLFSYRCFYYYRLLCACMQLFMQLFLCGYGICGNTCFATCHMLAFFFFQVWRFSYFLNCVFSTIIVRNTFFMAEQGSFRMLIAMFQLE